MKIKLPITLMLIPIIGMAHPGHEHNVTDILLNPLSWADHGLVWTLLAVLSFIVIRKVILKYFPNIFKSLVKN